MSRVSEMAKVVAVQAYRWLQDNSTETGPFGATPEQVDLSEKIARLVQLVVIISLLTYMTGVGMALDIERFKQAWKTPTPALVGLFCQIVINPFMIIGLISALGSDFNVETKVMALLIAASPGGNGSALLTYLAYGHLETSIAMTLVSTVLAFGTLPLFVYLGTKVFFPEAAGLDINFIAVVGATASASLPPLFGIWLQGKLTEKNRERVKNWGIGLGIFFTFMAAALTILDPVFRLGIQTLGREVVVMAVVFNAAALAMGYAVAYVFCLRRNERRTVSFEVAVQNLSIPLAVVNLSFGSGGQAALFTPFLGVYIVTGGILNYSCMLVWRYIFPIERLEDDAKLDTSNAVTILEA
uniref:Bile acid:sodium symporter n=1 Tax=Aplanochytrium stocchinoi TaxID=215587 RepID=A0A7S3LPV0_9STRA|mmetsp:Transcript_17691/g.22542  ORF Transcript_17691/g.22542 Transcript_17691/m.22542 type:complete len:355 (+) Transcript_17691:302-1366(+)|eukprot:CAMPEP_0204867970 /NCGR_PEP_ID=MMETSP1348-20121228/25073_1 /ASSEMBLY_ACC=CAM_ASM_000700 /TAXON_ID=215587 /ORGANISM="Aplanochytrium stocchinoi, Strain GSBS06" /LENGTH=354 /DNA_ID=CAMNT_0052020703 /DNA_START=222 /DNA_END=1286 /DNA_ORIENTATION=-